jgi:hypothetical protein
VTLGADRRTAGGTTVGLPRDWRAASRAQDEHHQVRRTLAGALKLTFCLATTWRGNWGSGCGAPLASPRTPFSC